MQHKKDQGIDKPAHSSSWGKAKKAHGNDTKARYKLVTLERLGNQQDHRTRSPAAR